MNDRGTNYMRDTDRPTDRYLSRVANEIGYKMKGCTSEPTDNKFFKNDTPIYQLNKYKMANGTVVTVYSFTAGEVFQTLKERTDKNEVDQFFAVDWELEAEVGGYDYHTFYFDSRPSKTDIRKARRIHQIKIAIENGTVDQHFRCEHCSKRIHWTNIGDDDQVSIQERAIMLKHQICNCRDDLDLIQLGMDSETVNHRVQLGPSPDDETDIDTVSLTGD